MGSELTRPLAFVERRKNPAIVLQQAIEREPHRSDLHLKLLELYYASASENRLAFLEAARQIMQRKGLVSAEDWARIADMGRQIAPDDELFKSELDDSGRRVATRASSPGALFLLISRSSLRDRSRMPRTGNTGDLMLYAILAYHAEAEVLALTAQQDAALMADLGKVHDRLTGQGKLGPAARLGATRKARTLRGSGDMVLDGPFAETKEQLLGFYIVDVHSEAAAIAAARELRPPIPPRSTRSGPSHCFFRALRSLQRKRRTTLFAPADMHDETPVPDSTAVRVALWRALHTQVDPPPDVFEDAAGLRLAGPR